MNQEGEQVDIDDGEENKIGLRKIDVKEKGRRQKKRPLSAPKNCVIGQYYTNNEGDIAAFK